MKNFEDQRQKQETSQQASSLWEGLDFLGSWLSELPIASVINLGLQWTK